MYIKEFKSATNKKSWANNAIEPTGNSLGGFLQRLVAPVGSWQSLGVNKDINE